MIQNRVFLFGWVVICGSYVNHGSERKQKTKSLRAIVRDEAKQSPQNYDAGDCFGFEKPRKDETSTDPLLRSARYFVNSFVAILMQEAQSNMCLPLIFTFCKLGYWRRFEAIFEWLRLKDDWIFFSQRWHTFIMEVGIED